MKLRNLNLGKPLSKEEQKQIVGGDGEVCSLGQPIECICVDGTQFPEVGDGVNTAPQICDATGGCLYDGGTSQRSNCQSF